MRYGTFLCWLFGHNFVHQCHKMRKSDDGEFRMHYWIELSGFCIRCGIDKE